MQDAGCLLPSTLFPLTLISGGPWHRAVIGQGAWVPSAVCPSAPLLFCTSAPLLPAPSPQSFGPAGPSSQVTSQVGHSPACAIHFITCVDFLRLLHCTLPWSSYHHTQPLLTPSQASHSLSHNPRRHHPDISSQSIPLVPLQFHPSRSRGPDGVPSPIGRVTPTAAPSPSLSSATFSAHHSHLFIWPARCRR